MRMTPDAEESIRCTVSGCSCVCFKPGSPKLRSCDRCGHGWVSHALEKLQAQPSSHGGPVEVALPGLVLDLSSLVLYGAQAIPVRLKILLDRLYSVLSAEQVGHILHTLGWTLGDYVRGYMLQFPGGKVLDRWTMVTPEEELLILRQFLRFGETRPIVELMTLQCLAAVSYLSDPELKLKSFNTFTEHNRGTARKSTADSCLVTGSCCFEKGGLPAPNDTIHHFENFPGGLSLLLPFHFPSSAFQCLVSPTKDLLPPTKLTRCLPKPKLTDGGRGGQEIDPVEPALKIKADPDRTNPSRPLWHLNPPVHRNQDLDPHGVARPDVPMSSSLRPSLSCSSSPPKIYQKMQSSSPSFHPLPSFSSSFLCPLPAPSFSSSLHPLPSSSSSLRPLPSSACSLPSSSPSGGRKGRVCCGVCGKSFYDKGTLKIHYNAVHLKIKHRCTVEGCTMVFSSLRSRNRHSANPNPRLHTGASRDAQTHRNTQSEAHRREKEINNTPRQQDEDGHTLNLRHELNSQQHRSLLPSPHPLVSDTTNNQSDSPAPPPASTVPLTEQTNQLHAIQTEPAPPPDHTPFATTHCNSQHQTSQRPRGDSDDPVPKKKPRKSSTPVKIERELEGRRTGEEDE